MKNLLFKGSTVCDGSGLGVVIEVGNSTQIGKLLAMFKSANTRKHSFKKMTTNIVDKYFLIFFAIIIIVGILFIMSGYDVDLSLLHISTLHSYWKSQLIQNIIVFKIYIFK